MSVIRNGENGKGLLALGGVANQMDRAWLDSLNITHILQVGVDLCPRYKKDFVYKQIKIADHEMENIAACFPTCLQFIDEGRRLGNVLVHCAIGVSRSASVVVAYLMHSEHLTLDDAIASVKLARPQICPNPGFLCQLQDFEAANCDPSVPIVWNEETCNTRLAADLRSRYPPARRVHPW